MSSEAVWVPFQKLTPTAQQPTYGTPGSAGLDLYYDGHDVTLQAHQILKLSTGIKLAIPAGWEGQVRTRSGMSLKGLIVANAPSTIDSDYRGELFVPLANISCFPREVKHGDRIAQLIIQRAPSVTMVNATDPESFYHKVFQPTEGRGEGGFGSTGR